MNSVREVLEKTLKKIPNSQKIRGQMILDAWPREAGDFIAHKTEALFVEKGTLYIRVADSVWAQHLSLQKNILISKLNRSVKTRLLKDIRFQVGECAHSCREEKNAEEENILAYKEILLSEKEIAAVSNAVRELERWPELRGSLENLLVSQKKWNNWLFEQGYEACFACGMPVYPAHSSKLCSFCRQEKII